MEINALLQSLQTALPEAELKELQQKLEAHINDLINNNFERLVQLLYTIDVDERELKKLLQQHPGQDAAPIISELMIRRQLQKAQTRQQFKTDRQQSDEERW